MEEILLEDNPLKVKRRNPKRSGAATSYATSTKSQATDTNIPEQSPERQLMEDKFLVYDHSKPEENENRKKMIEQRHWAQKMNKTTGEKQGIPPHAPFGSTRKTGGTYKASVLDYLNQKPSTPLSAGDILKLEELARSARSNTGKNAANDWRPPSGLMSNTPPDGSPMEAVQARDDYILKNGGVPPPSRPPPLVNLYSSSTGEYTSNNSSRSLNQPYDNSERNTTNSNATTYRSDRSQHKKVSQDYISPHLYHQRRRSSDDSYRAASSPDNCEYPLISSAAELGVEYNLHQPKYNPTMNNNVYSASNASTASSHTLHDASKSTVTISTSTTTNSRPPPARITSIPRLHGNPLPPPTGLPPPIPLNLPPLPPLPKQ